MGLTCGLILCFCSVCRSHAQQVEHIYMGTAKNKQTFNDELLLSSHKFHYSFSSKLFPV